ncbi:MAG: 4a-hydroxytetrahydrobiopterin dehydratase [Acidimicrobiales bacterium]
MDRSLLGPEELAAGLAELAWQRQGDEITKTIERPSFVDALAYVNEVGRLAEEADHHPDIDIRWDTVTLRLTTHSAGGLTRADLDLAGLIDALD